MANLDTKTKFHQFADGITGKKQAFLEVVEQRDGGVSVLLEEANLKVMGKKWHTTLGHIVLTPEQRAALKAVL